MIGMDDVIDLMGRVSVVRGLEARARVYGGGERI